jgi:hypothetical protein
VKPLDNGVFNSKRILTGYVDQPIAIGISRLDHLLNIFITQILAEVFHLDFDFVFVNEPVAVYVENFEDLLEFFLVGTRLDLCLRHHRYELVIVDVAIAVGVDDLDHLLNFTARWIQAQILHDLGEFNWRYPIVAILIEHMKCLLKVCTVQK